MNYDKILQKKKLLDTFRPLAFELVSNLEGWLRVELTYTSNAIEGNTLSRLETSVILEKGITIGGKTLVEHLEVTNHAKALDYIRTLINLKPNLLTENHLLKIHELILSGIDNVNAGFYRSVPVRISGSSVILPNPRKVPDLMKEFLEWLTYTTINNPIEFASQVHLRLVTIHPFIDGNGRTARLLMNLILMMFGFPPAIIRKSERLIYLTSLEKAQLTGNTSSYEKIMMKAIDRTLTIYLKAVQGDSSQEDLDQNFLLKIGSLAAKTNLSISTIRHWTKLELLECEKGKENGYQMYSTEMIKRCELIKKLKGQRLSLEEIKENMGNSDL